MKARIEVDDILDKARKRLAKIPDFPEKEKVDEAMRVAMVRMEEDYYDIAGQMKGWEKRIKDLEKETHEAPEVEFESQEEPPSGEHKRVIEYIMGEVSRATGKQYPHLRQELTRLSLNALLELKLLVGDFRYEMTVLKKKSQMGYPFRATDPESEMIEKLDKYGRAVYRKTGVPMGLIDVPDFAEKHKKKFEAMEGVTPAEEQAIIEEARRQDPKVMMKELDIATKQWGQMYSKAGFDIKELQKIQEKYYTPVRKAVEEYFRVKKPHDIKGNPINPDDIEDIGIFIVNEKMKTVWGHMVSEDFISEFPKDAAPGEGIAVVQLPDVMTWFFIFDPKTFKIRRGKDISLKGERISDIQAKEKAYKEKLAKLTGQEP